MYTCEHCGQNYTTTFNLNRHIKTSKKCLKERGVEGSVEVYACKYCDKKYVHKSHMKRHLKVCPEASIFW